MKYHTMLPRNKRAFRIILSAVFILYIYYYHLSNVSFETKEKHARNKLLPAYNMKDKFGKISLQDLALKGDGILDDTEQEPKLKDILTEFQDGKEPDVDDQDYDADDQGEMGDQHEDQQSEDIIRECKPTERLDALEQYCEEHPDIYKDTKLKLEQVVSGLWVDDVNKVLMCTHAKAGSSTWKMILANNTSETPVDESEKHIMIHGSMKQFGLKTLQKYSKKEIVYRLENYYKFMVVRHPFYRLQSFFNDKFVLTGSWNKTLGFKMMTKYHSEIPVAERRSGNITFSDWIRWIQDGNNNEHWDGPYNSRCHPCLIGYDRVVKLETQESDSEYIIFNKLRGRGFGTERNKKGGTPNAMLGNGKHLANFLNCTDSQMEFLYERLQIDLDMFGYTFDRDNLNAKCENGNTCC